jgi:hypothetical protein
MPEILALVLLFSAALLTGITSVTTTAKAQTTVGGHLTAALKIINDKIVEGGQSVVKQSVKGGIGFLKHIASIFGVHDIEDHTNVAGQDLTKGNTTGASSELKTVNKALLNDSGTLYGLGQRISQIAQNSSASINSYTKQLLSAIGLDLKNLSFNMEGIHTTSTTAAAK